MKIYIVHYTKLKNRKENISSVLNENFCNYEFIEKYDKEDLENNIYYFPDSGKFEEKTKLWKNEIHKFRVLNDAEISCTIKHILAIEKIANQKEDFGLILEDDAIPFENNFSDKIKNIIQNSPKDWDCIFIGAGCGLDFIEQKTRGKPVINDTVVKADHPATNCAESYLLKKESAKKILTYIVPFQLVSDWELAYQFYKLNMNVYWSKNPIFYQGSKNGEYNSTLR